LSPHVAQHARHAVHCAVEGEGAEHHAGRTGLSLPRVRWARVSASPPYAARAATRLHAPNIFGRRTVGEKLTCIFEREKRSPRKTVARRR